MGGLNELAIARPSKCDKCEGELEYLGLGHYRCKECSNEMVDNYGKIRDYYQAHGAAPVFQVARETGISKEDIHIIMNDNNIEKGYHKGASFQAAVHNDKMRFL